jgi:hypothetical protein
MDSDMASKGFMVIWIVFKNHLLEVVLTQNWEWLSFFGLKMATTGWVRILLSGLVYWKSFLRVTCLFG